MKWFVLKPSDLFLQFLLFPCLLMGLLLYSVDPNYCTCGYESAKENQNKISLFRLPTVVQNIKKNQKQARKWWFHTAFNPNRGSGSLNLKPALSTGQQRLHTQKKSCLKKKWKGWGAKKKEWKKIKATLIEIENKRKLLLISLEEGVNM